MKKFQFRLQKVKEIKEEIEKQKMQQLAAAQNRVAKEVEKLDVLYTNQTECYQRLEELRSNEKIDCTEMRSCYDFLNRLEQDIANQKIRIARANQEVEKRRLILLEAAKERKILDNLKDRQQKVYMSEIARKEQAVLDDLTITHFSPKR